MAQVTTADVQPSTSAPKKYGFTVRPREPRPVLIAIHL